MMQYVLKLQLQMVKHIFDKRTNYEKRGFKRRFQMSWQH